MTFKGLGDEIKPSEGEGLEDSVEEVFIGQTRKRHTSHPTGWDSITWDTPDCKGTWGIEFSYAPREKREEGFDELITISATW